MIMTQKNIELLLKDLSCRIPHSVIVNVNGISNVKLTSVSWYGEVGVDDGSTYLYPISEIKPYLFPMSSMTEEQKEEYRKVCELDTEILSKHPMDGTPFPALYYSQDWLNKNHFDYRGLIPMGLAIDATSLNIY
jgi:hypothetical protein